jgi:hypothetical protein
MLQIREKELNYITNKYNAMGEWLPCSGTTRDVWRS